MNPIVSGSGFAVWLVHCGGDLAGWSAPEPSDRYGLVLVRAGVFRWRAAGPPETADPTAGYLFMPGGEAAFAHPTGGDVCTAIHLDADLWPDMPGEHIVYQAPVRVDARVELTHRLLVRSGTDADYAGVERLLELIAAAIGQQVPIMPDRDRCSAACRRALTAAARDAIVADEPEARGLQPLARLLGVSPYHLSRTFHREAGVTLTRYRNRVRVSRALSRLEEGERNLARLAADLGFADQAHFNRIVRAEVGHTPAHLRRLLGQ